MKPSLLRAATIACGVAAAATMTAGVAATVAAGPSSAKAVARPPVTAQPAQTAVTAAPTTAAPPTGPVVAASTELASPIGTIPTSQTAGGPPSGTVGAWYGYPLTLPVIASAEPTPGDRWLEVRLPWRPNGSTAWVRAGEVTIGSTPWELVVDVAAERLTAYRDGAPVLAFPVAVGATATPTPTGHFFVAVHEGGTPPPGFGPVVLALSAHSETIRSWEGTPDAIIAIHGPVTASAAARIGSGRADLSNGCIRMRPADLAQLAQTPVGTPVEIWAG